jgi:hypothetical protein
VSWRSLLVPTRSDLAAYRAIWLRGSSRLKSATRPSESQTV